MKAYESVHLFESLETKLAQLEPSDAMHFRRDRWLIGVIGVGFVLTVGAKYLGGWSAVWAMIVGIVLETCALGVLAWRQVRDVAPEFVNAKRKFAAELDRDFVKEEDLRAWLDQLPDAVRASRLKYAQGRLSGFERRFPLVFGAVDKLGFLPVLAAVFLQVRGFSDLSMWEGILGASILVLYLMALRMSSFRLQLERYVRLLAPSD